MRGVRSDSIDRAATNGAVLLFAVSVGMLNLALPLLALKAGYSLAEIGILTALGGLSHIVVRFVMPQLAGRFADRAIGVLATSSLIVACVVPLTSTTLAPFVVAQVLQGAARGLFWTASQIHVGRRAGSSVRPMAQVNLTSNIGMTAGPVLAGVAGRVSFDLTLQLAAAIGVAATVLVFAMVSQPPVGVRAHRERDGARHHRTVRAMCVTSAAAGVWAALSTSYVPIVLAEHHSTPVVGLIVALGNAGTIAGSATVALLTRWNVVRWIPLAAVANGVGLALVAPLASSLVAASVIVIVSGVGSGAMLSIGPGVAADAVAAHELPGAVALVGAFRAAALLVAPGAVAGAVAISSLTTAMVATGAVTTLAAFARPGVQPVAD